MTPIKPEDRNKVYALIAAIVVVFGYGAWNFLGPKGGSTPPPAPATTPAPSPVAGTGVQPAPSAADAASRPGPSAAGTAPAGPARKNIFASVGPSTEAANATPSGPGSASVKFAKSLPKTGDNTPEVIDIPGKPDSIPGTTAGNVPNPGGSVSPAPVTPVEIPMQLIGVVAGQKAVAMIRSGEREYFVGVGEKIGGYKVARIGLDEVVLRRGEEKRTLRVGAPMNGEAGPNPGGPAPAGPISALPTAPSVSPAPIPTLLPTALTDRSRAAQ